MDDRRLDERYMRLALGLARRAAGRTTPNPLVGAVVVTGGRLVGRGYHRAAGAPHAEVEALRRAGSRARGGTLYVTLEPCNHVGLTPPCCDAILASGITRVVAAIKDPNPLTNGRGFSRLKRSGVRVETGVLAREAQRLNEPFTKAMTERLPLVIAKVAQSVDGKIATASGESRWITSEAARRAAHRLRRCVDAILVGARTVTRDDPLLTCRAPGRRADRPIKVIVDSRLRVRPTAACLSPRSPAPTLIATTARRSAAAKALQARGAEVLRFPAGRHGRVPLRRLCRLLANRGIQSVMIEGGGEVFAGALEERLVDRLVVFLAPILIGGRGAPGAVGGAGISRLSRAIRLAELTCRRVGPDVRFEGKVVYPGQRAPRQSRERGRVSGAGLRAARVPCPTSRAGLHV